MYFYTFILYFPLQLMKQLYLSVIFLLVCSAAYSQKDFRQGYIILNGDTIRGLVDYRGNVRSAQATSFKASPTGPEKAYTPDEISGYGFTKEAKVFASKLLPVSDSALATATQKTFLSVLVRGRASLYYYRDASLIHHYYLEKDTLFAELVEHTFRRTDPQTGRVFEGTDKKYLALLALAFSDCRELPQAKLRGSSLNHKSLSDITTRYNQCMDGNSTNYQPNKGKARISLGPALLYSKTELAFNDLRLLDQVDFADEFLIGGGLSLNLIVPEVSEKLSLQVDLLYIPYKFKGSYVYEREFTYLYEVSFDVAYLKLPLQLRYTYPKGRLRPFLNAGVVAGIGIRDNNVATTTNLNNSNNSITSEPVPFRRMLNGLTGGMGLLTDLKGGHTLSLEGRVERNNGLSNNSTLHNVSLMLSYGF